MAVSDDENQTSTLVFMCIHYVEDTYKIWTWSTKRVNVSETIFKQGVYYLIVVITICSLKRVSTSSVLQQNFTNTQNLLSQPTLLLVVSIEFAVFDWMPKQQLFLFFAWSGYIMYTTYRQTSKYSYPIQLGFVTSQDSVAHWSE